MRLRSLVYRRAACRGSAAHGQVNLSLAQMINWPSGLQVLAEWNCSGCLRTVLEACYDRKITHKDAVAVWSCGLQSPRSGSMARQCAAELTGLQLLLGRKDSRQAGCKQEFPACFDSNQEWNVLCGFPPWCSCDRLLSHQGWMQKL